MRAATGGEEARVFRSELGEVFCIEFTHDGLHSQR